LHAVLYVYSLTGGSRGANPAMAPYRGLRGDGGERYKLRKVDKTLHRLIPKGSNFADL